MSNVSLMPVAPEQSETSCANCGAALVADQRYCLACGRPCSPVRLAFLDVLQGEQGRAAQPQGWLAPGALEMSPVGYAPVLEQQGTGGWLRRNSGFLGLLTVLLLCLLVGLLVGHWVSQNKTPGTQVVKIEGLSGLQTAAAAATTSPTATTPAKSSTGSAASSTSAKEEAEESAEAAKETKAEKAPPAKPVQVTPTKLKKLTTSTGKKHQEEVNALGAQPIETG